MIFTLNIVHNSPDHRQHHDKEDSLYDCLHDVQSALVDSVAVVFINRHIAHSDVESHVDSDSSEEQEDHEQEEPEDAD